MLTPRTGYADEEAVVRHEVMPGLLREAAGVQYLEFTNLREAVPVTAVGPHGLAGAATGWADELVPEGAEVLAALRPSTPARVPGRDHQRATVAAG